MADNQQIDHYDFINAPQFVDFSDLAAQDDPDADRFFETHREEDDFMIPLDVNAISPTVQLLYDDESVHYSNEANKAAIAAGLEDVKIEYYSSPQQSVAVSLPSSAKRSVNSMYGTPLGASGMSSQSSGSFYTPTGETEDKENMAPSLPTNEKVIKKYALEDASTSDNRLQRNVLDQHDYNVSSASTPTNNTSPPTIKKTNSCATTESLMSRLDQLLIVSSDEEDQNEVSTHHSAYTPTVTTTTFTTEKSAFLHEAVPKETTDSSDVNNPNSSNSSIRSDEATVVVNYSANQNTEINHYLGANATDSDSNDEEGAGSMELRSPVNNILKILEAELREGDDDLRCSIVVAPRVGEQVHWNAEAGNINNVNVEHAHGLVYVHGKESNLNYDTELNQGNGDESYEGSGECSVDSYRYSNALGSGGLMYPNRASSVGDLTSAVEVEPKKRQFETYGYNPRVGITIPKTPDAALKDSTKSYHSNQNSCYFEIEAPKPLKSVRRVSSCSDLIGLQERSKVIASSKATRKQKYPNKGLTIPKTPDTLKRSHNSHDASNPASNERSTTSATQYGPSIRSRAGPKTGPTVAERLAAVRNRQPMKGNHYVSLAEAMIKFQKSTPDRFRSLPKGRVAPEKRASSCDSRRGKASHASSPDDSLSSRKDFDSLSEKRCNAGSVLPKKIELKPTVPKPFNLSSTYRTRASTMPKEDVPDFKFKARPAPSNILHENAIVIKAKPHVKVTQPMSPHFASDARLKERHIKQAQKKSPDPKPIKSLAKPSRLPVVPAKTFHTAENKTTVAHAFSSSFEARQKEVLRKKEAKIKQELEEAKKGREFHANPVPKFPSKLPKKKSVEVTHVEPFQLKSDARGAAYQELFKKKLEEEEQLLKEQAKFHAQPADVVHKPPFEPERHTRIIEPSDLHLATEKRAAEREHFEAQIRQKAREEEERRREQEQLEEIKRQEDIERRRGMVHKAQPFKAPKPFHPKASAKPLTVPQSPAFSALPSERRIKPHSPSYNSH